MFASRVAFETTLNSGRDYPAFAGSLAYAVLLMINAPIQSISTQPGSPPSPPSLRKLTERRHSIHPPLAAAAADTGAHRGSSNTQAKVHNVLLADSSV